MRHFGKDRIKKDVWKVRKNEKRVTVGEEKLRSVQKGNPSRPTGAFRYPPARYNLLMNTSKILIINSLRKPVRFGIGMYCASIALSIK